MSKLKLLAELAACKTAYSLLDVASNALELVSPSRKVNYGDEDTNDLINGAGGFAVENFRCNKSAAKKSVAGDVTQSPAFAHLKR